MSVKPVAIQYYIIGFLCLISIGMYLERSKPKEATGLNADIINAEVKGFGDIVNQEYPADPNKTFYKQIGYGESEASRGYICMFLKHTDTTKEGERVVSLVAKTKKGAYLNWGRWREDDPEFNEKWDKYCQKWMKPTQVGFLLCGDHDFPDTLRSNRCVLIIETLHPNPLRRVFYCPEINLCQQALLHLQTDQPQ